MTEHEQSYDLLMQEAISEYRAWLREGKKARTQDKRKYKAQRLATLETRKRASTK